MLQYYVSFFVLILYLLVKVSLLLGHVLKHTGMTPFWRN